MILFGDYHTHTIYSHGTGTVLDNAKVAKEKGLKEIAITDHGFEHFCYNVDRNKVDDMIKDIQQAKELTGVNVLFGMETNLMNIQGDIDLTNEEASRMDIVLMGFHKLVKVKSFKDYYNLFFKNHINKWFHYSKAQIERNTLAFLRAIDKNNIDVITHLNYGLPVNCVEIAKLAKEKGTLIELNGKRTIFTEEEIAEMVAMNTKFIINSDAHSPERVGECNLPTNVFIKNRIPKDLVVNLDKLPSFKNHKV